MDKNLSVSTLIILAGGKSSRMGQPKGLLSHNNSFWILSQIEHFIGEIVFIGLGFDANHYFETIPWLEKAITKPQLYKGKQVQVVINDTPELGFFSTLQNTLKKTEKNKQVLVLPIDVPLLNSTEQEKIISDNHSIVIPEFQDKKGHPVKLLPEFWNSLLVLNPDDEKARLDVQIQKRNASEISIIEVSDASCILNLNTPKDWQDFISS